MPVQPPRGGPGGSGKRERGRPPQFGSTVFGAFAAADAAAGGSFPFTPDQIRDAHSQWTAAWLAWEQAHDAEYKRRAAEAEHALSASGGSPLERARLEAVEREKLETYQRRYEEYIRVARKLQALFS